jgi:uncharacterized cupredoxin-like copper-binding protein
MLHPARLGAGIVVAGFLAGCTSERSAHSSGTETKNASPQTITIGATDYTFEAPDSLKSGATTFQLTNHGKELHQAQLVKFEHGKTLQDLAQAMKKPGPPPPWLKFLGGPNAIAPGAEGNATSVLAPGNYAYLCLIPSPDGVPHVNKGMAKPFTVVAADTASPQKLPESGVTITLTDYDFTPSQPLKPGKHTIRVENAGPQPHELALLRMAPGKKVEDFAKWAEHGLKGQPPAEAIGGIVFLENGGAGTFTVELTPGDYGLICFLPDVKDGKPHLAHGMMKTITVS